MNPHESCNDFWWRRRRHFNLKPDTALLQLLQASKAELAVRTFELKAIDVSKS